MNHTLIIAMPNGFDLNLSRASQTIRLGYYHGSQRAGLPARLVQYDDLFEGSQSVEGPIFWLTYDDYRFLNQATLRMLRDYPHVVAVNTWFDGMERMCRDMNVPDQTTPAELLRCVLDSQPNFVWCSTPPGYLEFYDGWFKAGARVVPLPWACDTDRYYPEGDGPFSGVEIAFVGGYRIYKEQQYGERLWPYEKRLKVWGYSEWPRCYQGYLPNDHERHLYSQAWLCPTLSEPHFSRTGDTVERPFKVMGCRGMTILDMPCYRELFTEEEALVATSPGEYHRMVEMLAEDEPARAAYREAGYRAIQERHTYAHRVRKILEEL